MKRALSIIIALCIAVSVIFCAVGCKNTAGEDSAYRLESTAASATDSADPKLSIIEWSFLSDSTRFALDLSDSTVNGYPVPLPFDWDCEGIDDRSTCYAIHGFKFLTELYKDYLAEGNPAYRDIIIAYMLDWVEHHSKAHEGSEWAWHDDAVARRVLRMSYFARYFREAMPPETYEAIKQSLDMQAALLADDSFYTRNHNHGMFQDMGLIAYAYLICDDLELSRRYFDLALSRSAEYYTYAFCSDGVHKEHSPNYAAGCLDYVKYYNVMYEGTGLKEIEKLNSLLSASSGFLAQLVMPDGVIASLGDSTKMQLTGDYQSGGIYYNLSDNPEYLYAFSGGSLGSVPPDAAVFPEGGYAVLRSSWQDAPEEATYMLFTAATHSSSHKHSDDLSLLLYHGGPVIVEAGKRDYNYLEEQTAYCYSGYGHNVLFINDEEFPVRVGQNGFRSVYDAAYKTGIADYDITSDIKYVTGRQQRFEGVVQTRRLTYIEQSGLVQVLDLIAAEESCRGTLIFHISPEIAITDRPDGWDLWRGGELIARVTVDSSRDITLSTVRENSDTSPYKTWLFDGHRDSVDGALLRIDIDCAEGASKVATNIQLVPLAQQTTQ